MQDFYVQTLQKKKLNKIQKKKKETRKKYLRFRGSRTFVYRFCIIRNYFSKPQFLEKNLIL
jgi:hypothetical protein